MIDYPRLLSDYNISYKMEVAGWINLSCPICRHEGKRGFKGGINLAGDYYYCWSCGSSNINKVFSELLGISFYEAGDVLRAYSSEAVIRQRLNKVDTGRQKNQLILPIDYLSDECRKYLIKRKFDPDYLLEKYHIVGGMLSGPWAGRVLIPIYFKQKLVSWQGRSILSKKKCDELGILRYKTLSINESLLDPKNIIYGIDDCKNDYCFLVEGPFDRFRIGDDAVATLGTSVKHEILNVSVINLLAKRFKKIYILFDPEKEAQERANKYANELSSLGVESIIVDTELDHDPGDMTEKEVIELKEKLL